MSFERFPLELRQLPQWVLWRYVPRDDGKLTKLPYDPKTFRLASVTDATTWSTFEHAAHVARTVKGVDGIGFVFTEECGFCGIDLDNTADVENGYDLHMWHQRIEDHFHTYSELSPSGKGIHMIGRGRVPHGTNARRFKVEMYSDERYLTVTGNVFRDAPLADIQSKIDWLYREIGGEKKHAFSADLQSMLFAPEKEPDQEIIKHAFSAANGEKFQALWEGRFQDAGFASQSEADFALVDMLQFFTQSGQQIKRLFMASGLGKREKAARAGYVEYMIEKSFDRTPRGIDMETTMKTLDDARNRLALEKERAEEEARSRAVRPAQFVPGVNDPTKVNGFGSFNPPAPVSSDANPYLRRIPGLMGDIAYFIYQAAVRPVPEIAVAGAIGLMSGICGRAFNVNATGLNTYVLLLARTGRGKEAIAQGIGRLMVPVKAIDGTGGGVAGADEFIGPQEIASGQALIKYMAKTARSFVSIMSEFDGFMAALTAHNASASTVKLRQVLLYAYGRSGRGQQLDKSIYSESDKNVPVIPRPAVALIGEGTPDRFYELLNESLIADGFLPRFSVIEYDGPRTAHNPNAAAVRPNQTLVHGLSRLCAHALGLNQKENVIDVAISPEAMAIMDAFNAECDRQINASNEATSQLWNRAHLKALKLAALVTVGCNWYQPVMDGYAAQWAVDCARFDTERLAARFERGDLGYVSGDKRQISDIKRKLRSLFDGRTVNGEKYKLSVEAIRTGIFNRLYLLGACSSLSSFKEDRRGATVAFDMAVKSLVSSGVIDEVNRADKEKLGIMGQAYIVRNWDWVSSVD